jgi:hypothetical protein
MAALLTALLLVVLATVTRDDVPDEPRQLGHGLWLEGRTRTCQR